MTDQWDLLISEISGIKPRAYLILGPGWVREDFKSLCFTKGKSITQESVQNLSQMSSRFVPESKGKVLDRSARVELLRQSFKDANLREALPTLFTHRFRPKFYNSLDRALQKGRMFFAHLEEGKVLEARLTERLGYEARREEFFLLNRFWEKLLEARNFFDEARVLEQAEIAIRTGEASFAVKKLYRAEHFMDPPRVQFLWQAIAEKVQVEVISSKQLRKKPEPYEIDRKLAHSLEDTVQFLFDEILTEGNLDSHSVVIEDRPEIRRSVKRVAFERGIALLDSRDPTLLMTSEEIKTATLPLEIVARNYPGQLVLPWLATRFPDAGSYRKKIIEYGNASGIESYKGVPEVYSALTALKDLYPGRITLPKLQEAIFKNIEDAKLPSWVSQTFERIFQTWAGSLDQLGRLTAKRPLRIFLDELRDKIKSTPPVLGPERNEAGLRLYRVDQAVSLELPELEDVKIHFLGLTSTFFEPRETSTEWFSVRDIEILASEFGIPGRQVLGDQAKASFCTWASQASAHATVWEYAYDEGGSETESLELSLQSIPEIILGTETKFTVHPKVMPSLGAKLTEAVPFEKIEMNRTDFPMSFLNSLGNCAFTAYAQHLLKLYDERDADFDLSGDSFGNLVHAAVETLVATKLRVTPLQAFDEAWLKTAKPAWIRSERLFKAIRTKTLSILEHFIESEKLYREQSHAELIGQEIPIVLKRGGFTFQGRMDRVDQHADGLVLMDYKTGSVLPSGTVTREKGKGLQLPAYALALKDERNQEVVGAQYIQLLPKKTQRNSGFLFARWNKGKKADVVEFPLSTATARSGSLIPAEPEEVWKHLDQKIGSLLEQAKHGNFEAKPADPKDCASCRYQLICGNLRVSTEVVEADDT